jgi:hypothetical protein
MNFKSKPLVVSLLTLTFSLAFGSTVRAECAPNSPPNNKLFTVMASARSNCVRASARPFEARPLPSRPVEATRPTVSALGANRWLAASAFSAANVAEHSQDTEYQSPVERSLSEVHWADSHDWVHNPPEWLKAAKHYRKQGMPIIHLIQSKETLVALGVNNHGKPGLYFTRKLPF